ncbi:MAG: hypothetical protein ACPG8W_25850, partial [Candidatus Promineifilaceae bacterium]
PILEPYFTWEGADGSKTFGVDLFGGYRNLYGVTHAPEVAQTRLDFELEKLEPYYPTPDIPLFDGYDLEDNPEDSVTFLNEEISGHAWAMIEATPESFVAAVQPKLNNLPTIKGELNSGKFGAIFPGVYSTRTYTRVLSRDCANLLYRWAEPLGVMAWAKGKNYNAGQYEAWSRLLLQNDVHDVTCGVSIDQVHEKAEAVYRSVYDGARADVERSLNRVLCDFAAGRYVVSMNPLGARSYTLNRDQLHLIETNGIGITPLIEGVPVSKLGHEVASFQWQNEHYGSATVNADGSIVVGSSTLGRLVISAERGDCYSDETKELLGTMQPSSPLIIESSSPHHATLCIQYQFQHNDITIDATARLILDESPLLRWEIDLDSRGVEFRVEMVFETGLSGQVMAGMQFDVVQRPFVDTDLFPKDVGAAAKVFMGQRELNGVRSFPFHEFVGIDDGTRSAVVFTKGINSYRAYEDGKLAITLRRSSEWVTRANLENRVGDAGPFFYVPDARCERTVKHELAFAVGEFSAESPHTQQLNAAYQNPPLIIDWGGSGSHTEWQFLQRDTPLSSLQLFNNQAVARWCNPSNQPMGDVAPKKIAAGLVETKPRIPRARNPSTLCLPNTFAPWRVGKNQVMPDPTQIIALEARVAKKATLFDEAKANVASATGDDVHLAQHQVYIHHREMLEYQLSARLNTLKLRMEGEISDAYLYEPDPEVVDIGWQLNQLRIKRRIYDYVAAALK